MLFGFGFFGAAAADFLPVAGGFVLLPFFPALTKPSTAAPPIFFAPLTAGPPTIPAADIARSHLSNFRPVIGSFPTIAS